MSYKQKSLDKIKDLYSQLSFENSNMEFDQDISSETYLKNKELSRNILDLVEEVLLEDPYDSQGLFWKIKIHSGPFYKDVSVMMQTCEFIIENLQNDLESVFAAYEWLAWCYNNELELPYRAIEVLHDLVIAISLIKDDIATQDKNFGQAYYLLALLYYNEFKDYQTSQEYYRLSLEHAPDHYNSGYDGSLLFLKNKQWNLALTSLQVFCDFYHNQDKVDLAKEVDKILLDVPENLYWDYLLIKYKIELEFYESFQNDNIKEVSLRYQSMVEKQLQSNPSNLAALQMRIIHFTTVEKNSILLFDLLDRYFKQTNAISNSYYYNYFHLGQILELPIAEFRFDLNGFTGYNLMTNFLEQADAYKGENLLDQALIYYQKAQEIGLHTLELVEKYQEHGIGDKANNNAHSFAMLCNNLSIAVRNSSVLTQEQDYTKDLYHRCVLLNKKGYEYSAFWENLDNGIRMCKLVLDYENCHYFATELLSYYQEYSVSWMEVQGIILKNYIAADAHEQAVEFYTELNQKFANQNILDQDVLSEMIYIAADFFTYLRFNKQEYLDAINYTQEFFNQPVYFANVPSVAKINYWFSLAWCYHALQDQSSALKYFTLMLDNYKDNTDYQLTIQEIPVEYTLSQQERQAINRLRNWMKLPNKEELKNFSILDTTINHANFLEHIVRLIARDSSKSVKTWIDQDIHIEILPRHIRQSANIVCFDTYVDIYLSSKNITIRFIVTESEQEKKTLFGLVRSLVWQKNFVSYVYHYQGANASEPSGFERFENCDIALQELVQSYWNQWLSKL